MTRLEDHKGKPKDVLYVFEGENVVESAVEFRNAGGGLNEALAIDPIVKPIGEEVFFVLRAIVRDVDHRPNKAKDKEDEELARVHVMHVSLCAVASEDLVGAFMDEMDVKLQARRDELAGQKALFEDERKARRSKPRADIDN